MGEAGPEVADTVAARMTDLANAVFPMSPMERAPTALGLLGGRGVSLRGAEVRLKLLPARQQACLQPRWSQNDHSCSPLSHTLSHEL